MHLRHALRRNFCGSYARDCARLHDETTHVILALTGRCADTLTVHPSLPNTRRIERRSAHCNGRSFDAHAPTGPPSQVLAVKADLAKIALTQPVCTQENEKIALSRRVEKHWR